jgi:hypothetical protein
MSRFFLFFILLAAIPGCNACLFAQEFAKPPANINASYWQGLRENSQRLYLPLDSAWQYSIAAEDDPDEALVLPAQTRFDGDIIYRRQVRISKQEEADYFLVCEGISIAAEIYFNDEFIGKVDNAWLSRELRIPTERILFDDDNLLEVHVSGALQPDNTTPLSAQFNLWANGNGIIRPIYIVAYPQPRLTNLKVFQSFAGNYRKAQLWSNVLVAGARPPVVDAQMFIEVALFNNGQLIKRKQSFTLSLDSRGQAATTLSLTIDDLEPWEPENPHLYQLRVSLLRERDNALIDRLWQAVGFRDIAVSGNRLLLNGRDFRLQGIDYYPYYSALGEVAMLPVYRRDFAKIKELGANTILSGGRPLPRMALQAADEIGLFVLQEAANHAIPRSRMAEGSFLKRSSEDFATMLREGRNHASVLAWGIGRNLDAVGGGATDFLAALRATARQNDSRPLFMTTKLMTRESLAYGLDFIVIDAFDWRDWRPRLPFIRQRYPGKPVILSGIGALVDPGREAGTMEEFSLQAQAAAIGRKLRLAQNSDLLNGLIVHSFTDYTTHLPNSFAPLAGQAHIFPSGIFAVDRQSRPAADVVTEIYANAPALPLTPGQAPTSPGFLFIAPALLNLIMLLSLYRTSPRFRDNFKRSLAHPFSFFSDIRDRRVIPLGQSAWLIIIIALNTGIFMGAFLYHIRAINLAGMTINLTIPSGFLREFIFTMMWDPLLAIPLLTLLTLAAFVGDALLIRTFAIFTRSRVLFRQCLSTSFWAGTPYVMLVIPGLLFFTLFGYLQLYPWLLGSAAFFVLWHVYRFINGARIVLDVPLGNVFIVVLFIMLFTFGTYLLYMHNRVLLFDYLPLLQEFFIENRW